MKTLSSSVEDYLKAIYEIQNQQGGKRASTSALAATLGVAQASVTGMLKKLSAMNPELVNYQRYQGVALTPAGKKFALEIIRHHRLIELYLSEALGYSWDEVDREADRLEHVISEDLEDRIASMLGNPDVDPHGAPIPDRDGNIFQRQEIALTYLKVHQQAFISRVSDHDPNLLRDLQKLGLTLKTQIEITERASFSGPISVRLVETDTTYVLGRKVTDHVFVAQEMPERQQSE